MSILAKNYDHLVEQLSIYEDGHCYVGKNKRVIPAPIDKSKFFEGMKSMLKYAHKQL